METRLDPYLREPQHTLGRYEDRTSVGSLFTQVVDRDGMIVAGEREFDDPTPMGHVDPPQPSKYVDGETPAFIERGLDGESGFIEDPVKNERLPRDTVAAFAPVWRRDLVVVRHFER